MSTTSSPPPLLSDPDGRLIRIEVALHEERDPLAMLARVLTEARRLLNAEAGTLFLVDGDVLRFAVVQNDFLERRIGEKGMRQALQTLPLPLTRSSLAGYVALTREALTIADVYRIPDDRPYIFNRSRDLRNDYRTRSLLAVPIEDREGRVLGVLQLINALDAKGRAVPFGTESEPVLRWFAGQAARVIPELVGRYTALALPTLPVSASAAESAAAATEAEGARAADVDDGLGGADPHAAPDRGAVGRRLGDLLLAEGAITLEQLAEALAEQRRTQHRLGAILVRYNYITEAVLVDVLARQYHLPLISLAEREIAPDVLALVPAEVARRHTLLPFERTSKTLSVAVADPTDLSALDNVAFLTGLSVVPALAAPSEVAEKIDACYAAGGSLAATLLSELQNEVGEVEVVAGGPAMRLPDVTELRTSADEAPVVRVVNAILIDAIKRGASDIHFECFANSFRVRFRIDGALQDVMAPAKRLEPAIVSRIKIMADLDIAEHRLPQDGRTKLRVFGREIDLRVSVIPTLFGESVDIRLLDASRVKVDLRQLGLAGTDLDHLMAALQDPNGVILVTGPTGSGKTTTLYSMVRLLAQRNLKILTIEDPVEYVVEGVNQVHVNDDIGRTFAAGLRSFLRHDPDVILVGEVRDQETAQIAVRAGLTGHLVLSTLHTNDGPSTIARLLDMGVAPFLLSSALRLVVAQRLVRRLCPDCRTPYDVSEDQLVPYGLVPSGRGRLSLYKAGGCPGCNHTGFRGRMPIFEVMPVDAALRPAILGAASVDEIRAAARLGGMATLRDAALRRLVAGETTLEEVVRMTVLE